MKNFQSLGVQELNSTDVIKIKGGSWKWVTSAAKTIRALAVGAFNVGWSSTNGHHLEPDLSALAVFGMGHQ